MAQYGITPDSDNYQLEQEFKKNQGRLLRKARKNSSKQFSQAQVGAYFGLSQDTISKIEKGEQSVSAYRLLEFARLYNKPVSFFYMVNPPNPKTNR